MDYRILGPLEVCDGDRTVGLGGDKQRALLAILLLHAHETISTDRLIDELWGERPPPTALKALRVHVSRLRTVLAVTADSPAALPDGVLVTRGHGYLLRVEPGELDVERFRGLVEEGHQALAAGDPDRAAGFLREALALWRGPPLADFSYQAFAQQAIAELEELRLGAVEARVEADLAVGRHDQIVGELAALVEQNPLRERLRGQLMLALYRCGREAEALDVYQEFRRRLAQELGLDPSPRLQQLEAAILARDPSVDPPARRPLAESAAGRGPPRLRVPQRLGQRLAIGGLLLVAFALAAAVIVSSGGGAAPPAVIAADSVGAINPARGTISTVVPVGSSPSSVAAGDGGVWVASYSDRTISRIDPRTDAVKQTIQVDSTPSGIAAGPGAVWVADTFSGTVSRIDPTVDRVVQTIPVGNGPRGVAVGGGSVWVSNSSDGTLSRIDPVSGAASAPIALGAAATDLAFGYGAVWVSDEPDGRVLRVDPQTSQVTDSINVGAGPTAVAVGYGSVWVTNSLDETVSRINPQTDHVLAKIPVGDGPKAIVAGAGGVWVTNEFGGTVVRIDPATNSVAHTIIVGNRPQGVAIAGGLTWVSSQASDTSHRGGTLTLLSSTRFDTNDPAAWTGSVASALTFYMTNDGLTAFKRVGGPDGTQVVPDLAVSLPAPTDSGRTYTFRLRPGIHYSNGQLVRPEDFRRGIERGFELPAFAFQEYYSAIVGAAACVAHPPRCDLSHGIIPNDANDTVTFHLVAPDPEFLERLALLWAVAVPAGTPTENINKTVNLPAPLPATGPYRIASYAPAHEIRLVRNRYFREWSHAARPDGYPDQIIWKIGARPAAAVTAVERGRADYTLDGPSPGRLTEVQTRFASQLHPDPNDITAALFFNTQVAPFNDVRVRQALNFAIDRGKVARMIGLQAQPTCQLLPPYVPGYRRYCPYTLDPNRTGTWSGPDLARARSLIAASHTRGMRITIWTGSSLGIDYRATARYVVSLLNSLGYHAHLTTSPALAPGTSMWWKAGQAAFSTAAPAYAAASEFVQFWFSCQYIASSGSSSFASNISRFCSPRLDATMDSASAAEAADGPNSPAAAGSWASADRQVTNQAPLVPLVTTSTLDFVSRHVGNYQYNPEQGILLDQLWVK